MAIKFKDLQHELKLNPSKLCELRNKHLLDSHFYKFEGNSWFTEEGADKIRLAVAVPLAVPVKVHAFVARAAPNPRWVYCSIPGQDTEVPVAIPRSLYGRLVGKSILVDIIEDAAGGKTYRHEQLGR